MTREIDVFRRKINLSEFILVQHTNVYHGFSYYKRANRLDSRRINGWEQIH
jgi:hypothetical protein